MGVLFLSGVQDRCASLPWAGSVGESQELRLLHPQGPALVPKVLHEAPTAHLGSKQTDGGKTGTRTECPVFEATLWRSFSTPARLQELEIPSSQVPRQNLGVLGRVTRQ